MDFGGEKMNYLNRGCCISFLGQFLMNFFDKSKFLDSIKNGEGKVGFWGEKMNNSGPILDEFLDKSKFLDSSENEEGKN